MYATRVYALGARFVAALLAWRALRNERMLPLWEFVWAHSLSTHAKIAWSTAQILACGVLLAGGVTLTSAWGPVLDACAQSEDEARGSGVRLGRVRAALFIGAGVLSAVSSFVRDVAWRPVRSDHPYGVLDYDLAKKGSAW